jgi:Na+-transporting NADH:ubiquinone oxidoreductase subunit NqrB
MAMVQERSVRLAGRRFPVVLPNRRDARLHTAAVIISLHAIGITTLGFAVSVPQVATAMVTAGLIDFTFTLRRTGKLIWPASGLLTGSGVGLILRLTDMTPGRYWTWEGWYWFALVAGFSILTKFLVRYKGHHVFNPSNVGLVLGFLIIGSDLVEPLDFWWAPLGPWMIAAYVLIVGGGVLITRRLALLEMAFSFWLVLAAGLGILAASGHCMTASWSPTPVCDGRFWTVLVTSPEVLIFALFMITDPRTIPERRGPRLAFAASLAVLATLLMAPQTVEFGAKVGLLGSLVLWSPIRSLFDRVAPVSRPNESLTRLFLSRVADSASSTGRVFARGVLLGSVAVVLAASIVGAGVPARTPVALAGGTGGSPAVVEVDAGTLPPVDVDSSVQGLDASLEPGALALTLAENLATEAEAIRTANGGLLGGVDAGDRLAEMQARLDEVIATGERRADIYRFEGLALRVSETSGQSGATLTFDGTGTLTEVVYDHDGEETGSSERSFESEFVLAQIGGERWLLVEVGSGQ